MLDDAALQRFAKTIESSGYRSIRAFAEAAGLNNVSLGDVLRKGNEPRFGTIVAILKVANRISAEWLMLGEGDMFRSGEVANTVTLQQPTVSNGGIAGVNHLYASDDVVGSMRREIETLTEEIKSKNRQIDTLLTMLNERVKQ